jgi:hypothetical protein
LRPIPRTILDGIYNADGRALTADEKKTIQNPGYWSLKFLIPK